MAMSIVITGVQTVIGKYHNVALISAIAAGVLLLIAVVLFFAYNVPKIIGEKTGYLERKEVERLKAQSYGSEETVLLKQNKALKRHGETSRNTTMQLVRDVVEQEQQPTGEQTVLLNADYLFQIETHIMLVSTDQIVPATV